MEEGKTYGIRGALLKELFKPSVLYKDGYAEAQAKVAEIYTDFVLNFLMKKKNGVGKIDSLVLRKNSITRPIEYFFEREYSIKLDYVDVIKKTDDYYILKINESGISRFELISVKYKIYVPTFFTRFRITAVKQLKKLGSFLAVTFPSKLKMIMDSGIVKLILFMIALITFILKYEEIKKLIHKLTE